MPSLPHEKAIAEYWEQVKEKYPDIDFTKFKRICRSPFEYIKKAIRDDSLPIILIKFFGKIRPYPPKLKSMISAFKDKAEEHYVNKRNFLIEYLKALNIYDDSKRKKDD